MTLNSIDSLMRLVWISCFSVGIFFITYPDFINAFILFSQTHEEIANSDGMTLTSQEEFPFSFMSLFFVVGIFFAILIAFVFCYSSRKKESHRRQLFREEEGILYQKILPFFHHPPGVTLKLLNLRFQHFNTNNGIEMSKGNKIVIPLNVKKTKLI
ncbi:UNVERIFIED_CONTAM: hypothetical protein RMT77_013496 [Armadillidium vulgare]